MSEEQLFDFKVDLDHPLPNPRPSQADPKLLEKIKTIPVHGSVGFFRKEDCKSFRKFMTKIFGKGAVAQRTIPTENGVQYRIWRLR